MPESPNPSEVLDDAAELIHNLTNLPPAEYKIIDRFIGGWLKYDDAKEQLEKLYGED